VSPDDVTIDAGRVESGDGGPNGAAKDVGIRADRADGFVLRNVKVRHAKEHDIYVLESDGYVLDRFKTFYGGEYGVLTFVEDHGLMENCEAAGNGDSGLYPGAGAETGNQRDTSIYPEFRYSQEIRDCDSHHNTGGYSGTDGNAVHVHDNNFYDNALGFTTDVFTAAGHPGFPQDSDLIEKNNFYDNNFNPYTEDSDVAPSVPLPVGTGLWIAGGNDDVVRNNRFYDNWRRGVHDESDRLLQGQEVRPDAERLARLPPVRQPLREALRARLQAVQAVRARGRVLGLCAEIAGQTAPVYESPARGTYRAFQLLLDEGGEGLVLCVYTQEGERCNASIEWVEVVKS
jgi:hypothetical protein